MGFLDSLFNMADRKDLKKFEKTADLIESLEPKYEAMNDEELRGMTDKFKERSANGETVDDILPEAFAVVREASKRTLGLRHYKVQLIGGMVLHEGRIAEMKTGEGKTLVATCPVYLNALEGKGVHGTRCNCQRLSSKTWPRSDGKSIRILRNDRRCYSTWSESKS